jgi:hypothetical protein
MNRGNAWRVLAVIAMWQYCMSVWHNLFVHPVFSAAAAAAMVVVIGLADL